MIVSMSPKSYRDGCLNSTSSIRTEFLVGTIILCLIFLPIDRESMSNSTSLRTCLRLSSINKRGAGLRQEILRAASNYDRTFREKREKRLPGKTPDGFVN